MQVHEFDEKNKYFAALSILLRRTTIPHSSFLIPHSSFLIPDFPHRFPIIHSGGFSMESKLVLYDNYKKANGSFTWYLEDREVFNTFAFKNDKLSMIASLPPDKNFLDDLDRAVSTYLMTCGE